MIVALAVLDSMPYYWTILPLICGHASARVDLAYRSYSDLLCFELVHNAKLSEYTLCHSICLSDCKYTSFVTQKLSVFQLLRHS